MNSNIVTVASKEGHHGAVVSKHPNLTVREISENVEKSLKKDLANNIVYLPKSFDVEIQYRQHNMAYNASFFPGCKLVGSDKIIYHANNYYDVLVMLKFLL